MAGDGVLQKQKELQGRKNERDGNGDKKENQTPVILFGQLTADSDHIYSVGPDVYNRFRTGFVIGCRYFPHSAA
jgi:hypothetical protein